MAQNKTRVEKLKLDLFDKEQKYKKAQKRNSRKVVASPLNSMDDFLNRSQLSPAAVHNAFNDREKDEIENEVQQHRDLEATVWDLRKSLRDNLSRFEKIATPCAYLLK